jgi:hypothetical protein
MSNDPKRGTCEKYEMIQLITTLTKKIDTLERTVTELKANVRKRYTKKATLKSLNDLDKGRVPFVTFQEFISEVAKTTMDFETIENQDMTIHSLFVEALSKTCTDLETRYPSEQTQYVNTALPIMAFAQHKNVFFIYGNDSSSEWEIMNTTTYQRMVQSVHMYLISRCSLWRDKYLPPRDLVIAQDLAVHAYMDKRYLDKRSPIPFQNKQQSRKGESVVSECRDVLSGRTESAQKYHKIMNKICNINVCSPVFNAKIKCDLYSWLSAFETSSEYFARVVEKHY